MPYVNQQLPDHVHPKATPSRAVMGALEAGVTVDSFVAAMADLNVSDDRIHVLHGEEGVDFLQNVGTAVSRLFGDSARTVPLERLEAGATLVGVFGVDDADQDRVADGMAAAGVQVLRRYGRWTYR